MHPHTRGKTSYNNLLMSIIHYYYNSFPQSTSRLQELEQWFPTFLDLRPLSFCWRPCGATKQFKKDFGRHNTQKTKGYLTSFILAYNMTDIHCVRRGQLGAKYNTNFIENPASI